MKFKSFIAVPFVRFALSSLVGFLVDIGLFALTERFFENDGIPRRYAVSFAVVIARVVSCAVNYLCNRLLVFRTKVATGVSFGRYLVLVVLIMALGSFGTTILSELLDAHGGAITVLKVAVDTVLFVLSYWFQKVWVFGQPAAANRNARHVV